MDRLRVNRRWNPCIYLPRRLQVVVSIFIAGSIALYLLLAPTSDDSSRQLLTVPHRNSASRWNPFSGAVHAPPQQLDSTSDEASWFSDLKWLRPFASSATSRDNRLILPPEPTRVPVYTYYDNGAQKNKNLREADHELLLIWRRAWWAKGFRPVVLGKAEALQNPLYIKSKSLQLEPELETDLLRWLAWGNMGSGILANYLAVPMSNYDDTSYDFLRAGAFPQLTRYEGLEDGVLAADKTAINEAVEDALATIKVHAKTMMELVPKSSFRVEPDSDAIAYYTLPTIEARYKDIAGQILSTDANTRAEGMHALALLVTSHLHTMWQNTFRGGISVIKPAPEHMTLAVTPAVDLAYSLSWCSESPQTDSCPPNKPHCTPCIPSHPIPISLPKSYRHTNDHFTIGTVPHPYTYNALLYQRETLSTSFVRRKTARDQYVSSVSKGLPGLGINTIAKLVRMKELIASPENQSTSIWLTAERDSDKAWHEDLSWIFGFAIPLQKPKSGRSSSPVPGKHDAADKDPLPETFGVKAPDAGTLRVERTMLESARRIVRAKTPKNTKKHVRSAVEAWNLADTELWRFVRAINARRRLERTRWEHEERGFAGSQEKSGWSRWLSGRSSEGDNRM